MNYNFKKDVNTDVKITHDNSVVQRRIRQSKGTENKTSLREGGLNAVQTMGLESALGKDERLFKLKVAIQNSQVQTVTAASQLMGVGRATIKRYIHDLNKREPDLHIELWDDQKNKLII